MASKKSLRQLNKMLKRANSSPQADIPACDDAKCRIPQAHYHTGETETDTWDEYYCPMGDEWGLCPGPCPDGTPHTERREFKDVVEVIQLLE